ncbi:hypothetical protein JQC67_15375 [Aurantibacter crassamenti]|uniref:DUF6095 family protein n=1 Tax=Aurantibacter crassamenti TaxID=1837375 RepID=UPI00193AC7AE|nr:DUF6095 family protein [Aurantibacter crassamenti]MBM1107535.1 hypothetical protein [Aurantibacter crassamenti]
MKTDRFLLVKGLKYMGITIALMFTAPVILSQAFKNVGHPFFWPIVIIGGLLAIGAIAGGFYGIKVIMDALFSKKK